MNNQYLSHNLVMIHDKDQKITFISNDVMNMFNIDESFIGYNLCEKGIISEQCLKKFTEVANIVQKNKCIIDCTISFVPKGYPEYFIINLYIVVMPSFDDFLNINGNIILFLPKENYTVLQLIRNKNEQLQNLIQRTSKREFEIFYLLTQNLSQNEIATNLKISKGNVSKIIGHNLMYKLGVNSTDELISLGVQLGINHITLTADNQLDQLEPLSVVTLPPINPYL